MDPPRSVVGTYLDWIDWRDFIIERTTWQMQFRVDAIKEVDTHTCSKAIADISPPLNLSRWMA